jgi:hypothetical protein
MRRSQFKDTFMGLFLFGFFMVFGSFLGLQFGIVSVFGLSFTLGIFFSVPLYTLRDILQEQPETWIKFLLIPAIAYLLIFFMSLHYVHDPLHRSVAVAISITWTLLVDRNVYTWFRKFGWGTAMIVSDLIAVPMVTIFFFYLYKGGWSVPDGQLIMKYLTLVVVYAILFSTGWIDKYMKGPRFIKLPREEWFKFYE